MRNLILIIGMALALSSCDRAVSAVATGAGIPAAPVVVADHVKLDEQFGLTITLAYTAASRAAGLAIETGIVSDRVTIAKIGKLNTKAFAAVLAVRHAYTAANADGYLAAIKEAREAVAELLAAVHGPVAANDTVAPGGEAYMELSGLIDRASNGVKS